MRSRPLPLSRRYFRLGAAERDVQLKAMSTDGRKSFWGINTIWNEKEDDSIWAHKCIRCMWGVSIAGMKKRSRGNNQVRIFPRAILVRESRRQPGQIRNDFKGHGF